MALGILAAIVGFANQTGEENKDFEFPFQEGNGTIPCSCYRKISIFALACCGCGHFCQDTHRNFGRDAT